MQNLTITVENQSYPVLNLSGRPKALLDRTVAQIYGVKTKHINQAIARNPNKFPPDFYFELTIDETRRLREVTNCDLDWKGGYLPKALTHLGCNMVSTILKSEIAVRRAVQIIRAFTELETSGASSIEDLKEMMHLQNQIIIAINNQLQDLGIKHNKDVESILKKINSLEQKVFKVEKKPLPQENTISKKEALELKTLANGRCTNRKQIMKLWAEFKRNFEVTRYVHLPKEKFDDALLWISCWG